MNLHVSGEFAPGYDQLIGFRDHYLGMRRDAMFMPNIVFSAEVEALFTECTEIVGDIAVLQDDWTLVVKDALDNSRPEPVIPQHVSERITAIRKRLRGFIMVHIKVSEAVHERARAAA